MNVKVGIDIVNIEQLQKRVERNNGYEKTILTRNELSSFKERNSSLQFLAGRIAAKEALFKALGTGITKVKILQQVEVCNQINGKPVFKFLAPIQNFKSQSLSLSISHDVGYAAAMVSYLTQAS